MLYLFSTNEALATEPWGYTVIVTIRVYPEVSGLAAWSDSCK
jgi:hypothetical protein